jgi:hypothetical protein
MTPIRDLVAAILARVLDARRREDEDEAELVARHPVADPEDEAFAERFREPAE